MTRAAAFLALLALPLAAPVQAQSETAPADVVPIESVSTKAGPRIHLAAVVDQSGCKGLSGGLLTSGGMLAGGLLGHKAGVNPMVTGQAGKMLGSMHDKAARCRQDVKIDPAVVRK